jgi:hypothetical protein
VHQEHGNACAVLAVVEYLLRLVLARIKVLDIDLSKELVALSFRLGEVVVEERRGTEERTELVEEFSLVLAALQINDGAECWHGDVFEQLAVQVVQARVVLVCVLLMCTYCRGIASVTYANVLHVNDEQFVVIDAANERQDFVLALGNDFFPRRFFGVCEINGNQFVFGSIQIGFQIEQGAL